MALRTGMTTALPAHESFARQNARVSAPRPLVTRSVYPAARRARESLSVLEPALGLEPRTC